MKDARFSLPLTEVMKIARLTSPLLDAPRQSSPRLRHGRQLVLLFHLGLTLNLCTLFFVLSLALLPRLPLLLTFLTVLIPIHKMGKPLDSPASFRPISLTSCVSNLFERIIQSRLFFFLESNSIFSPRQASFRPGRSTLDQILYLSQSISDGFNKPRPGSRTMLSTIDFSKAFDSVWHPALFHKLISAGFLPCFARWNQSFLSDRRACVVFQNHKSRSFRVRCGVPQGSVLGTVLFSLFINDLLASLPSSVSCSLYADDLAIWSSSPTNCGEGTTRSSVSIGALV